MWQETQTSRESIEDHCVMFEFAIWRPTYIRGSQRIFFIYGHWPRKKLISTLIYFLFYSIFYTIFPTWSPRNWSHRAPFTSSSGCTFFPTSANVSTIFELVVVCFSSSVTPEDNDVFYFHFFVTWFNRWDSAPPTCSAMNVRPGRCGASNVGQKLVKRSMLWFFSSTKYEFFHS
jgi:hypothetical protein